MQNNFRTTPYRPLTVLPYHWLILKQKIVFLLIAFLLCSLASQAQYYYKDIVSNKQVSAEWVMLKEQKVRNILVHSFEANGEASRGFYCEKKISKDYKKVETYTKSNITGKSLMVSRYNKLDQLLESYDSSELSVSSSAYEYDENGNLAKVTSHSHSNDDDFKTTLSEEHIYSYDGKGKPTRMVRVRNTTDTAIITFTLDERGNVIDEVDPSKNGKHYYYYYNERNRLTDIVKLNLVKQKLLPDFVFQYNSAGQVSQMVAVEEGLAEDYYTWKYVYNDGLRIIEKCFSKENILLGYFEYEYN